MTFKPPSTPFSYLLGCYRYYERCDTLYTLKTTEYQHPKRKRCEYEFSPTIEIQSVFIYNMSTFYKNELAKMVRANSFDVGRFFFCMKNFLIYIAIHNFYFMANNRYQKVFLFALWLHCVFLVHISSFSVYVEWLNVG